MSKTLSVLSLLSLCLCGKNVFAFSADYSLVPASALPILARGGHTRASRGVQRHQPGQPHCNCVVSADCSLLHAC